MHQLRILQPKGVGYSKVLVFSEVLVVKGSLLSCRSYSNEDDDTPAWTPFVNKKYKRLSRLFMGGIKSIAHD